MTPSVRADNRFRLQCPVVQREERYMACVLRRHRFWRGESVEGEGCAAAMAANKCPVIHMIMMETPRNEPQKTIFFDPKGEKVFGLPKAIAERIEKVVVLPTHCRRHNVSPEMFEILTGSAPGAAPTVLATAPVAPEPTRRKVRREAAPAIKSAGDMSDILDSGNVDIAAALNAAAS